MTFRSYLFAALFAAGLVVAGIADGVRSGRWRPLRPLDGDVARLQTLPTVVGDWVGTDLPMAGDDLARAGIAGSVSRQFRNRRTDSSVSLLVVIGRGGPICAHTPDVCYRGSGYEFIGGVEQVTVRPAGRTVTCQTLRLRPPATRPGVEMEVTWGWVTDAGVTASETPRVAYAGLDSLYKFYLVRDRRPTDSVGVNDVGLPFLAEFIPHLEALVDRSHALDR